MDKRRSFLLSIVLFLWLLSACATPTVSTEDRIPPEDGAYQTTPDPLLGTAEYPLAVLIALEELSQETAIPAEEVAVVSYKQVEWPTACLGFSEPGEMCAQVITPGWLIVLKVQGENFEFHTDQDGSDIRWRSQLEWTET